MRTIESINLIYRDPKVRGGRPCIVGTGLRVKDIVLEMRYGRRRPEQIAAGYVLKMEEVYAALAYYHLHKDEIEADILADVRFEEQLEAESVGISIGNGQNFRS